MSLKVRLRDHLVSKHPKLLAAYDYYCHQSLTKLWGPFNGQAGRQQIFRDLITKVGFRAVVETGTYRGVTTDFMATESKLPLWTVEFQPRYFHYATLRFRSRPNIRVALGDSRVFLEKLAKDPDIPKQDVLFYLDSHWFDDLPLNKEIELIVNSWKRVVILIDDFQVPGDAGYMYDDYGNGNRLSLDYLDSLDAWGLTAFFPELASARETGAKRGCLVLADKISREAVRAIPSLRENVTQAASSLNDRSC